MRNPERTSALAALILLLASLVPSLALAQSTERSREQARLATVVLAVDLRELTSIRDVGHVGDVFFRRSGRRPDSANDYDLAIRGSVAADWKGVFGGSDDNRAPRVYAVAPGTYVIEKINIGSGPTTVGPGIDGQSRAPRFGSFVAREGEVLNLGRLIVHMHWHEGYFSAKVEDNAAEAKKVLAESHPGLAARLQTRMLSVVPSFPFTAGGGRL